MIIYLIQFKNNCTHPTIERQIFLWSSYVPWKHTEGEKEKLHLLSTFAEGDETAIGFAFIYWYKESTESSR
jgi:hypothetical protein